MKGREAILRAVDDSETTEIARFLVKFDSYTGNEGACTQAIARLLREMGMQEVILDEVAPGQANVIARTRGSSPTRFMFNGHADIDPLPDEYALPQFTTWSEDGLLIGTGLGNMKAGIAAMIEAAVAVQRSGVRLRGSIELAIVVGELLGGIGTKHLIEHHRVPPYALVPEPTGMVVRTLHAGCLQAVVRITDSDCAEDEIAVGLAAARRLAAIQWPSQYDSRIPGLPRLSVGGIIAAPRRRGNRTTNEHECLLLIDVRIPPGTQPQDVASSIRSWVAQGTPHGFDVDVMLPPVPNELFGANAVYQPPLDIPVDHVLPSSLAHWHQFVTGEHCTVGFDDPGSYAGADTGWLSTAGCACVNYGPASATPYHDRVALDRLNASARIMALVAAEFCGAGL